MAGGKIPIRKLMGLGKLKMATVCTRKTKKQIDKQGVLCQAICLTYRWMDKSEFEKGVFQKG